MRYLFPEYQAPDYVIFAGRNHHSGHRRYSPALTNRATAPRHAIYSANNRRGPKQRLGSPRFRYTKADKINSLLDMLAMMSQVRHLESADTKPPNWLTN